ncbi:hypothetical protein H7F51_03635 [Novosphingobium flavum]|uniref:PAS domain-containing protein n=1 Tax=Novosphingobium flavum TaxID=1778672 RepID=A0A7X1FPH8_9SPHN|nr:hypothetical protein [Novosphingobium flavum]MBC2664609.1 hypothetical protein [Novosphingobium flavum]
MDTLRGPFGDYSEADAYDPAEDEIVDDTPPPAIGQDERRMQVRAYNHWASLLGDRPFPLIADLETGSLPEFDPYAVLLDFAEGVENPIVRHIGAALAAESQVDPTTIRTLSDVPGRSLLSRITDHYMQILANEAPIGFEAEFVNQRGGTILYRGILLPFSGSISSRGIDQIYGVINWKELADRKTTEALMSEIDQALKAPARAPRALGPMTGWADGPADLAPGFGAGIAPGFSMAEPQDVLDLALMPEASEDAQDLAGILASARALAAAAQGAEDRSHQALYAAIGRAHDFALAAAGQPDDLAGMIAEAGIALQERAPLIPVVKLVFGPAYDKTRLTEYATVLAHADRIGLGAGDLAAFIGAAPGGLKGVVQLERRLKRGDGGREEVLRGQLREAMTRKLRDLPTRPLQALSGADSEFTLVLTRRTALGEVVVVGDLSADEALFERAARRLLG